MSDVDKSQTAYARGLIVALVVGILVALLDWVLALPTDAPEAALRLSNLESGIPVGNDRSVFIPVLLLIPILLHPILAAAWWRDRRPLSVAALVLCVVLALSAAAALVPLIVLS